MPDIFGVKPGTIRCSKRDVGNDSAKDYYYDHLRKRQQDIEELIKKVEDFNPITDFLPAMAGSAGKALVVNGAADGVEYADFIAPPGYSDADAIDAVFPGGFATFANRLVRVNATETGLEATDIEYGSPIQRIGNNPLDFQSNDLLDGAADYGFAYKSVASAPHASSALVKWGIDDGVGGFKELVRLGTNESLEFTGGAASTDDARIRRAASARLNIEDGAGTLAGIRADRFEVGADQYLGLVGGGISIWLSGLVVQFGPGQINTYTPLVTQSTYIRLRFGFDVQFEDSGALTSSSIRNSGNNALEFGPTGFASTYGTIGPLGFRVLTTAAAPGVAGIDDPDTGLGWGTAANTVVAYAGGVEVYRWDTTELRLNDLDLAFSTGGGAADAALVRGGAGQLNVENGLGVLAEVRASTFSFDASRNIAYAPGPNAIAVSNGGVNCYFGVSDSNFYKPLTMEDAYIWLKRGQELRLEDFAANNTVALLNGGNRLDIGPTGFASTYARIDGVVADMETSLWLLRDLAGVETLQRVTQGATDSGGVGLRALVVPN